MSLYLNEDYENFMAFRSSDEMNEASLKKQIDNYFDGQVSTIVFNANAQRAFFDSRVFEPIWKGMEKGANGKYYFRGKEVLNDPLPTLDNALNAKLLHENVANPFQFRIDCARRNGGEGWLSMRMNDNHLNNNEDALMHSELWRENPQCRLERHKTPNGTGLNYANMEVRKRVVSLMREYFMRFDMDGFELDWMRMPPFFIGGTEDKNRGLLDEIVRTARRVAQSAEKRCGHKIKLAVRVPSRPEEALRLGLDVAGWARNGWIDVVIPCAFIGSTDGSMPLEIWRILLPEKVELIPGIDILTRPHPNTPIFHNLAEFVNGFAAAFYYRGIKNIYLFNHMDSRTGLLDKSAYRKLLQHAGSKETVEKTFRRHVVTMVENLVPGISVSTSLPLSATNSWQEIRLEVGGGLANRKTEVLLAFKSLDSLCADDFEVRVDGVRCSKGKNGSVLELPSKSWQKLTYEIPNTALCPGSAVIEFKSKRKGEVNASLQWCEIDVY